MARFMAGEALNPSESDLHIWEPNKVDYLPIDQQLTGSVSCLHSLHINCSDAHFIKKVLLWSYFSYR